MGLAMYATNFDVGVSARYRKGQADWMEISSKPPTAALFNKFVALRRTRGVLAKPDQLAKSLVEQTGAEALQIQVVVKRLDGARGFMQPIDRQIYDYDGNGEQTTIHDSVDDPFMDLK
jgi:hypothetical protein